MKETPRHQRSAIFHHLAELLSVEGHTWEMVAMVFFTEVSLTAPLQAPPGACLSHAHHCGGSWGASWSHAGAGEPPVRRGAWGTPQSLTPLCSLAVALVSSP